jgi:hypothetical protein
MLTPGDPSPAGRCPDQGCQGLCYVITAKSRAMDEAPAMLAALKWAIGMAEEAIMQREGDDEDDEPETTASHRAELVKAHALIARIEGEA